MPSQSARSFELLENVVLGGHRLAADDEKAKEALIDCLLITLEAAEELNMNKTVVFLDIASDFAFAEVQNRPLPKSVLAQLVQSAVEGKLNSDRPLNEDPIFTTSRQSQRRYSNCSEGSVSYHLDKRTA